MYQLGIFHLIIFFLIVMLLTPVVQLLWVQARRALLRRRIARARGTRIVDIVHGMEAVAFYGVPVVHWVSLPLTHETQRDIAAVPPARPLDLVVHLPGGIALGADAIARALLAHPGKVTLVVPQYALSSALLLALAADEVLMSEEAALGAFDVRADGRVAADILLERQHSPRTPLQPPQFPADWQRSRTLNVTELRELGIAVSTELPRDLQRYLTLYRQPSRRGAWPFLIRLPASVRRP